MIRVVHLLATAGGAMGGMERHAFDLVKAQASVGQRVSLVADTNYLPYVPEGVDFYPVDMSRGRRSLLLRWQVRKHLKSIRPNVVHAQGGKAAAILSSQSSWLRRSGCTCIGTVHGTKSGHKAYSRLDGIVAVSAAIASQLGHPRVETILNGVAPKAPNPELLAKCRGTRTQWTGALVVAVGRLAPVKGYDVLLQAWPKSLDAHLLILGDGPEMASLKKTVIDLGLTNNVSFAGYSMDVTEWLHVADAMVISSHREGFPYVLVEALQAGCPVLSTAVSGVSEILPINTLAKPGNISSLKALLEREIPLLESLRLAQEPQFLQARTLLTLEAMAGHTLSFYESFRSIPHA